MRGKLTIPALRAHMGDWIYYIAFMTMRDIAERVSIAEEIHTSKSLNTLIQRQITRRSTQIRDYLLNQPQRFFNSLVIGVYGGSPQWFELAIKGNAIMDPEELPSYIEGAFGILVLEGSEKLFAIDGQHRVVGIKKAVEADNEIGDEEVGVIFVSHCNDSAGLERTRRLFTTLNRYAKPVSKKEIIALDEDDVIAITTRRLVEEYPLFKEKISLAKGKNIPVRDNRSLTTIVALYDVLDIFLRTKPKREWNDFKKSRPNEDTIEKFYNRAKDLWDAMIAYFPPLRELRDSNSADEVAAKYRHKRGGHLLFRPVGLLLTVKVLRHLIDMNVSLDDATLRISRVPMDIAHAPWVGLLWDATNQRMITAPENQKAGIKLLFYAVGGDLSELKTTPEELRKELAGLLNVGEKDIKLPRYD